MSILFRTRPPYPHVTSKFGVVVSSRAVPWLVRSWICVVVLGSLLPHSEKVLLHASEDDYKQLNNAAHMKHRFIHFCAFGSSFLMLGLLATSRKEELEAAAEVIAVDCIVELVQYFVYSHGQLFEWWDVRDDTIGVAAAFILVQMAHRVKFGIGSGQ